MGHTAILNDPAATSGTVHCSSVYVTTRTVAVTALSLGLVCLQFFPDRFVRREILNFKVICTNHSLGCLWEGLLSDYEVRLTQQIGIVGDIVHIQCMLRSDEL